LFENGSGTERDTATTENSFDFIWQTTSATSMTVTSAAGQTSLTDIQFAGRNAMSLVVADALTLSCERQLMMADTPETPAVSDEPV